MTSTNHPFPFTTGATAYGSHYLGQWDRCERKGFFSFLAPHPKGGQGLKLQYPPRPLKLGGILHEGWAAYYRSGPRDPSARNVDLAVATLEAAAAARAGEWQTPEQCAEDTAKGRAILYDYHAFWKGDPDTMVVEDADGPLIEREWVVEIPGCSKPFTCRPDAVVEWNGWVYVMEHKSTTAWGMNNIRTSILNSIQGTGECYILSKVMPHLPVQGVLLNVALKDRSSKSKYQPFERDTAARTAAQLQMFEDHVRERHARLDARVATGEALSRELGDPWAAGARIFVATGASTGACENTYGRPCEYLDVCKGVGNEQLLAQGFVAHHEANPTLGDDLECIPRDFALVMVAMAIYGAAVYVLWWVLTTPIQ